MDKTYTQADVEAGFKDMLAGYEIGHDVALNLKPGMYFGGAWGQTELAGIAKDDHLKHVGFTQGFLDGLRKVYPNGVYCDAQGVITK